jgi:hypothetical protein
LVHECEKRLNLVFKVAARQTNVEKRSKFEVFYNMVVLMGCAKLKLIQRTKTLISQKTIKRIVCFGF